MCVFAGGPIPTVRDLLASELHLWTSVPGRVVAGAGADPIPQPARDPATPDGPDHRREQEVHRPLLVPGKRTIQRYTPEYFVPGMLSCEVCRCLPVPGDG